jgi:ParB family transcriptional regulator, chromosome partitioning protein
MSKLNVPSLGGVNAYLSISQTIEQIEQAALSAPPTYVDARTLVKSPYQPRTYFDPVKMAELKAAIIAAGAVKVPLIVRPGTNEIIAGERRKINAVEAGNELGEEFYQVPVYWYSCTDKEAAELAAVDNINRDPLNSLDETVMVLNMIRLRLDLSDTETAIDLVHKIEYQQRTPHNVVGKDNEVENSELVAATITQFTQGAISLRAFATHRLTLLNLPEELQKSIASGDIQAGAATLIAKLPEDDRAELIDRVKSEGLSVRKIKDLIKEKTPEKRSSKTNPSHDFEGEELSANATTESFLDRDEDLGAAVSQFDDLEGEDELEIEQLCFPSSMPQATPSTQFITAEKFERLISVVRHSDDFSNIDNSRCQALIELFDRAIKLLERSN